MFRKKMRKSGPGPLEAGLRDYEAGNFLFENAPSFSVETVLKEIWARSLSIQAVQYMWQRIIVAKRLFQTTPLVGRIETMGPIEEWSEWYIGMTAEFAKNVRGIDRKMQGRILEALSLLVRNPTMVKGDTVKPLSLDKKGLWRYRLGDYRMVYQPEPSTKRIILIAFAARGDVYEN